MRRDSVWTEYAAASRFFVNEGGVYDTLRRLARAFDEERLDYAVIGGMAVVAHGYRRLTEDVDVLVTPETLERFRQRLVGRGYRPAFPKARKTFRDTVTGVKVEFVAAGEFPGDGKPKPVAFPDPSGVRENREGLWLITLDRLIELKLASGLSAPHRLRDLADVQELIARRGLPLALGDVLEPSVREEYRRLWHAARTARPEE